MKKRIAISQSNYIPWKGYFDFISRVDEFVLFDDVQYTRRDWRNRNKIKTPQGLKWLTIPVTADYHDNINEVEVADENWFSQHWKTVRHAYSQAPCFDIFAEAVEELYKTVPSQKLSEINFHFISGINKLLHIDTPLTWSRDYEKTEGKTRRLVSICRQAGAEIYVTGPAARDYLDVDMFNQSGIEVEWMDYENYKSYPQIHGEFEHAVTVIDLLFHLGHNARDYMKF